MPGTTTGETTLATLSGGDDTANALKVTLTSSLQALADKFDSTAGHDHSGAGLGKKIGNAGIASGTTLTAPIVSGGLTVTPGTVGIGGAPNASFGLWVANNSTTLTGTSQYGIHAQPSGSSAATTEVSAVVGNVQGAASATTTTAAAFHAITGNKGSGGTVTSMYGLLVDTQTQGGTNNYGVYITAPSGGSGENLGLKNLGAASVNGAGTALGFFGGLGTTEATVSGSRGSNAALQSLINALVGYGLIADTTTA